MPIRSTAPSPTSSNSSTEPRPPADCGPTSSPRTCCLFLVANAGVLTATADAAPDAWRRLVGYLIQARAASAAQPLPDPPTPRRMYRAMLRSRGSRAQSPTGERRVTSEARARHRGEAAVSVADQLVGTGLVRTLLCSRSGSRSGSLRFEDAGHNGEVLVAEPFLDGLLPFGRATRRRRSHGLRDERHQDRSRPVRQRSDGQARRDKELRRACHDQKRHRRGSSPRSWPASPSCSRSPQRRATRRRRPTRQPCAPSAQPSPAAGRGHERAGGERGPRGRRGAGRRRRSSPPPGSRWLASTATRRR